MRRFLKRFRRDEKGVVMVEGTIGIVLLLLAAMAAVQVLLVVHGALAARQAATAIARTYAITRSRSDAEAVYEFEKGNSFRIIRWEGARFGAANGMATAEVTVYIPPIFPGAGIFGDGLTSGFTRTETGVFPLAGAG